MNGTEEQKTEPTEPTYSHILVQLKGSQFQMLMPMRADLVEELVNDWPHSPIVTIEHIPAEGEKGFPSRYQIASSQIQYIREITLEEAATIVQRQNAAASGITAIGGGRGGWRP